MRRLISRASRDNRVLYYGRGIHIYKIVIRENDDSAKVFGFFFFSRSNFSRDQDVIVNVNKVNCDF